MENFRSDLGYSKNRYDAWTASDDQLLAETVIDHIKQHSTQQKAFEQAGRILGRSPAACAYQWVTLKFHYIDEIKEARQYRYYKEPPNTIIPPKQARTEAKTVRECESKGKKENGFKQTKELFKTYTELVDKKEQMEREIKILEAGINELSREIYKHI